MIRQASKREVAVAGAYQHTAGKHPSVLFCGGYTSDMTGTKATALETFCRNQGRAFTRFDDTGHWRASLRRRPAA
jgi:hypothetical protein